MELLFSLVLRYFRVWVYLFATVQMSSVLVEGLHWKELFLWLLQSNACDALAAQSVTVLTRGNTCRWEEHGQQNVSCFLEPIFPRKNKLRGSVTIRCLYSRAVEGLLWNLHPFQTHLILNFFLSLKLQFIPKGFANSQPYLDLLKMDSLPVCDLFALKQFIMVLKWKLLKFRAKDPMQAET